MTLKVFYKNLLFVGTLLIVSFAVFYTFPQFLHSYYFHTLALTVGLMSASLIILLKHIANGEKFILWFLVLFIVRFLVVASVFLVLVVKEVPQLKLLSINFFLVYLIYLVFEITQLLGNLRANS